MGSCCTSVKGYVIAVIVLLAFCLGPVSVFAHLEDVAQAMTGEERELLK
jgi:hypothetical protein